MKIPLEKFEEWLANKNLKEKTIMNYLYYFQKFTYKDFNQENVLKFLTLKENRNSNARGFLKNFQKFLKVNYKELGLTAEDRLDISEVELPQITGRKRIRLINPLPHENIAILEMYLKEEKDKLQLLLNYYCALRLGELIKIRINDFNWDIWKKDPSKMGECRVFGKGDKEGVALVPEFIMRRLAAYIRDGEFKSVNSRIFIKDDERVNLHNVCRRWEMILRKAGIDSGLTKLDQDGKPIKETAIYPHRLRHSYASYLINEKNMDIREVQEILRHSSIHSTQIYTHINKEKLKERLSRNDLETNN